MKFLEIPVSILFAIAVVYLCVQIIHHSRENQKYKIDNAELNSIQYGLLSIEEWNRQITSILVAEIGRSDLLKSNKREIRNVIESSLGTFIDTIYRKIKTNEGRVKQLFLNFLVDLDEVKKGIPQYTDAIMAEISKTKNKKKLENILVKKVEQYSRQTYSTEHKPDIDRILRETKTTDIQSAKARLGALIFEKKRIIQGATVLLLVPVALLFLITGFSKGPLTPLRFGLLILTLLVLLTAGVTTPMIDLEAEVSHLRFVLMGHPIQFEKQVLYFQSKSLLDVFQILIRDKDMMMKSIGVLILTFGVVFPVLKIFSAFAYYFDYRHARRNPIVGFFVLQSGKWSMADVMVVAIFMAYIGFNGIIDNQFEALMNAREQVELLTTNGTALQPGYYLFVAFCVLGLFFGEFMAKKIPEP